MRLAGTRMAGAWTPRQAAIIGVGGFCGIAAVGGLGLLAGVPLLIAPFGSTCMMIFGAPRAPFAQPRNVLGGHLICTVTGLVMLRLFSGNPWAIAAAVGLSMGLMGITRTFHPPAGGDPVLIMLVAPAWTFVFVPILVGCVVLLAVAIVFHNFVEAGSYPARGGQAARLPRPDAVEK